MVPSKYERTDEYRFSTGVMEQWPPFSQSSRRPKQLAESTRGMQHQSIEPLRWTKAIEQQSLISA